MLPAEHSSVALPARETTEEESLPTSGSLSPSTTIDVDDYSDALHNSRSAAKPQPQHVHQSAKGPGISISDGANVRPSTIQHDQLPILTSVLVVEEADPPTHAEQQQHQHQPQHHQAQHNQLSFHAPLPSTTSQTQTSRHSSSHGSNPSSSSNPGFMDAAVTIMVPDPVLMDEIPNHDTSKVMGEAQPAQLTDFLENRQIQRSLGGFLCMALSLAILVLVLVFLTQPKEDDQPLPSPSVFPSVSFAPSPLPSEALPAEPTASPTLRNTTPAPTVTPLLLELSNETVRALKDPLSPQSQAYAWLENHPQVDTLWEYERAQIMGVLTIYYALNGDESFWSSEFSSPKGNWLSYDVPFCDWTPFQNRFSNTVQDENYHMGMCAENGRLTHLNLHNIQGSVITSHRHGSLPPEVGLLSRLERFEINNCQFDNYALTTFLPEHLGSLPNLQKLQYVGNNFEGTIPSHRLSDLAKLTYLSLDGNALRGSIPSQVGVLTSLHFLSLSWNSFRQTIPSEIGLLQSVETLRLYKNRLVGPVPTQIAQLTRLKVLELQNNDISGALPSNLCSDLTLLQSLRLDCHQVTCPDGCDCNCFA